MISLVVILHAKTVRALLEAESIAERALWRLRNHDEGRVDTTPDVADDDDSLDAIARRRCGTRRHAAPNYYHVVVPDRGQHLVLCDKDSVGIRPLTQST